MEAAAAECSAGPSVDESELVPDETLQHAADNLKKKPKKSILKSSSSLDQPCAKIERIDDKESRAQFDEMNILQTLHPPDKDYGHMKVDEPKTPYHNYEDSDSEQADVEQGAQRVRRVSLTGCDKPVDPISLAQRLSSDSTGASGGGGDLASMSDDEDWADLTDDQKLKRRSFEARRKEHYNEAAQMARARELIAQELAALDDDDSAPVANGGAPTTDDVMQT